MLTGSQTFPLMQGITESLAGRVAVLTLQSLSMAEIAGRPESDGDPVEILDSLAEGSADAHAADAKQCAERIVVGGYPEPSLQLDLDARRWHAEAVERFQNLAGDRAPRGYVVCLCPEVFPLSRRVDAIPIDRLLGPAEEPVGHGLSAWLPLRTGRRRVGPRRG